MVRQTSLAAFKETLSDRALRQRMVYDAIAAAQKGNFVLNDRMIAAGTGLLINQVTPRRGELVEKDLVVEDHRGPCPISGRQCIFWRVNRQW